MSVFETLRSEMFRYDARHHQQLVVISVKQIRGCGPIHCFLVIEYAFTTEAISIPSQKSVYNTSSSETHIVWCYGVSNIGYMSETYWIREVPVALKLPYVWPAPVALIPGAT